MKIDAVAKVKRSRISGKVQAISAKAELHRIIICSALSGGVCDISYVGTLSDDVLATIRCAVAGGAGDDVREALGGGIISVKPGFGSAEYPHFDCAESGSTLRFMLPVAAAMGFPRGARFAGRGRLPQRPIAELMRPLAEHGASFSADRLPFTLTGRISGGEFSLPGNVSSQYVTGLLLALPLVGGGDVIVTTPLGSAPYVDITRAVMARFGANVGVKNSSGSAEGGGGMAFSVPSDARYTSPGAIRAGGDWSAAAFFLATGALAGEVTVTGLDMTSPQGDRAIIELLRRFGADISVDNEGGRVTARKASLRGCEIDADDIPDLVPVLAAVAAAATGVTVIRGVERLRHKESDRVSAVVDMIRSLGGDASDVDGTITIRGGDIKGGFVNSRGDHRIAMAATVAGVVARSEVTISDAMCVAKSHPGFYDDFALVGGIVDVIPVR
ncbi:MAG: 3-phosphoshikimate 1-carboxyvinyltransferase [Eubacteriales bacterium]